MLPTVRVMLNQPSAPTVTRMSLEGGGAGSPSDDGGGAGPGTPEIRTTMPGANSSVTRPVNSQLPLPRLITMKLLIVGALFVRVAAAATEFSPHVSRAVAVTCPRADACPV